MIEHRTHVRSNFLNPLAGAIIVGLSSLVLFGWFTNNTLLTQISPKFSPMQINTALCFFLAGLARIFLNYYPKISGLLGCLISTIGFLTFLEYLYGVNYGIDTIFMKSPLNTHSLYPGRMAPNTAIAFCIAGLMFICKGLLSDRKKYFFKAALILNMLVFTIALVALLGYLSNISSAYAWGPFSGMALHGSAGFIILCLPGFERIYYEVKDSIKTNSYFLATVVFTSMLTIFLILTQIFMSRSEIFFEDKIKFDTILISEKMLVLMKDNLNSIERLFNRLNHNSYPSLNATKLDAELYIRQTPEISLILIHLPDKNKTSFIAKQKNISPLTQQKLIENCQQGSALKSYFPSPKVTLSISSSGLCIEDSVSKNLAILNLSTMLLNLLDKNYLEKYYAELTSEKSTLFQSERDFELLSSNIFYAQAFYFENLPLKLNLYLKKISYLEIYGWVLFFFICFGIFLSALISFMVYLWQSGRLTAQQLNIALSEKRNSEDLLNHIVSSSPGAILMVKKNDTISFFNKKALDLWGYSKEEFLKKSIGDLMPERFRQAHFEFRQKYYKNPKPIPLGARENLLILNKLGREIPVELELNPLKIKDETEILCTFMNIEQRKRNEAQIKKYTEDLKRSNDALHDFAYIASHDLKEPLRGISNFSAFLLEDYRDQLDSAGKEKLHSLQKLSKRMGNLIETLLFYSRVGSVDLQLKSLSITSVIEDKLSFLNSFLTEKNAKVLLGKDLPTLVCDDARIGEVFQNLITNAVKYNDSEEKIIYISSREENESYVFSVQDNGIGIAKENFDKIFKIFKRLHGQNEYDGGTGAGMTIIKKIVERHEGKIWLESSIGLGTTFYFTISKHLKPFNHEQTEVQNE